MNENRPKPGSNFEDRLLKELRGAVEQRDAEEAASVEAVPASPAWRRPPRVAAGAAAVCAVAGAVLVFNSGSDSTSKAFAVEPQDGGGVTISVFSAEEAGGLEKARPGTSSSTRRSSAPARRSSSPAPAAPYRGTQRADSKPISRSPKARSPRAKSPPSPKTPPSKK